MVRPLYLDTARMGRTSPSARKIQTEYLQLSATLGCPPEVEDFLTQGGEAWAACLRRQYPALARWRGVAHLKSQLRRLVGADKSQQVLLASRTRSLMRVGVQLLGQRCQRVLVTDLGWTPYNELVRKTIGTSRVVEVRVRSRIETEGLTSTDVTEVIHEEAQRRGVDGAFFSTISHDGVRLPVRSLLKRLSLRGVVLDGAQEVTHANPQLRDLPFDLYLAGTHKWLRGHQPMGFGVVGRRHEPLRFPLDDPLTRFCQQLENQTLDGVTETTAIGGMLAAYGATVDAVRNWREESSLELQKSNASRLADRFQGGRWRPVRRHDSLSSGILLLRDRSGSSAGDASLRRRFSRAGVVLSVLENSRLRLSMPRRKLSSSSIGLIEKAITRVSG